MEVMWNSCCVCKFTSSPDLVIYLVVTSVRNRTDNGYISCWRMFPYRIMQPVSDLRVRPCVRKYNM